MITNAVAPARKRARSLLSAFAGAAAMPVMAMEAAMIEAMNLRDMLNPLGLVSVSCPVPVEP